MVGQETETKKEEEALCDKAGKLAGGVARRLYSIKKQVEKQLIELTRSTYRATQQALKKGKAAIKDGTPICRRLERKWALWQGKQKLNTYFTQLGTEVARLHKEQTTDIFKQSKIREIIKQIHKIEQHLEKIKEAAEAERLKKEKPAETSATPAEEPENETGLEARPLA